MFRRFYVGLRIRLASVTMWKTPLSVTADLTSLCDLFDLVPRATRARNFRARYKKVVRATRER